MSGCDELKRLLSEALLPDLEAAIDDLFETIADAKNADETAKSEYAELQELKAALHELLEDLNEGEVDEAECAELFEELRAMVEAEGDEGV